MHSPAEEHGSSALGFAGRHSPHLRYPFGCGGNLSALKPFYSPARMGLCSVGVRMIAAL